MYQFPYSNYSIPLLCPVKIARPSATSAITTKIVNNISLSSFIFIGLTIICQFDKTDIQSVPHDGSSK